MKDFMLVLGNILWFIFGGFVNDLSWLLFGMLWCITIIGIPVGLQCFKMVPMSFAPFGKDIVYGNETTSVLLNVFWIIFGGIEIAFVNLLFGILCCITIIGIPFGLQYFKLMKLSLCPFGAMIIEKI